MVDAAEANEGNEDEVAGGPDSGSQRLDKWLWFVRVAKTRTLAARLVSEGKVRLNRERINKPSQRLKVADVVTVAAHDRVRILKVKAMGLRRGPPAEAQALFEDLTPPAPPRPDGVAAQEPAGAREPGAGRPTKRDRRLIERLQRRQE